MRAYGGKFLQSWLVKFTAITDYISSHYLTTIQQLLLITWMKSEWSTMEQDCWAEKHGMLSPFDIYIY